MPNSLASPLRVNLVLPDVVFRENDAEQRVALGGVHHVVGDTVRVVSDGVVDIDHLVCVVVERLYRSNAHTFTANSGGKFRKLRISGHGEFEVSV